MATITINNIWRAYIDIVGINVIRCVVTSTLQDNTRVVIYTPHNIYQHSEFKCQVSFYLTITTKIWCLRAGLGTLSPLVASASWNYYYY